MKARARTGKRARSSAPGRGRRTGQTSRAIKSAARENGAKGGRPRDKLPDDVIARLGPPPPDAAGLRLWAARVIAETLALTLQGKVSSELAATVRATATSLDRALPSQPPPETPDDPDQDDGDEPDGPELERVAGDDAEPLHVS